MSSKSQEIAKLKEQYLPKGVSISIDAYVETAKGSTIVDTEGKEWIDFAGGIGVINLGHCNTEVVQAIKDQADKFIHTMINIFPYEIYLQVCKMLTEVTPGDFPKKTLLINSGAEADENAVKIARKFTGRTGIIVFDNAFHGRTNLTMAMTSKNKPYKFGFGPFNHDITRIPFSYCYRCPYGLERATCDTFCGDRLDQLFDQQILNPDEIACLVMEPIQGEGGFCAAVPEFAQKLKKTCEKHGIVFISDEIQSGYGRSGKMYAIEHTGVVPDLICTAKSIAAGMPLSAVVGRADIMDASQPGGIGGTFAGNPLSCAAALKVAEIYKRDNIVEQGRKLGVKLNARLQDMMAKYSLIGNISGVGPMAGIEFVKDLKTKEPAGEECDAIVKEAAKNGLVVLSCAAHHNVIRFLMPLTITDAEFDKGMGILEAAIKKIQK